MPRIVVIAPVGWYENRLVRSLYKCSADSVYLVTSEGDDRVRDVTEHFAKKVREKVPSVVDKQYSANFRDYKSAYRVFAKIINEERNSDGDVKIIIDVTSTTKDGLIAASLISRLYDVTISYVPPTLAKLPWADSKDDVKNIIKQHLEEQSSDKGGEHLQYTAKSVSFDERWVAALSLLCEKGKLSMKQLADELGKRITTDKSAIASYRYWTRLFNKLESEGLVEVSESNEIEPSDLGRHLVRGITEGIDEAKKKRYGKK